MRRNLTITTTSSRASSLASTIRLWLTASPRQAAASGRTVSATIATAARKTWRDDFAYRAGVRSCRRAQPAADAAGRCARHVCRHWHDPARSRIRTAHDDRPGRTLFRAMVAQLSPNLTYETIVPTARTLPSTRNGVALGASTRHDLLQAHTRFSRQATEAVGRRESERRGIDLSVKLCQRSHLVGEMLWSLST
jgi:hypothetical protein